eukprot:GHVT01046892.1.p1 GENE.GHVT01046892.1~~GHVT01046892.1.p1  ORF type:complete len:139 (-),score=19.80 GHVT01046892.1:111-527(-)
MSPRQRALPAYDGRNPSALHMGECKGRPSAVRREAAFHRCGSSHAALMPGRHDPPIVGIASAHFRVCFSAHGLKVKVPGPHTPSVSHWPRFNFAPFCAWSGLRLMWRSRPRFPPFFSLCFGVHHRGSSPCGPEQLTVR